MAIALVVSTAVTAHAVLVNNNQTYAHSYLNRAQSELHARPGPYALMRTKLPVLVAPSFIDPFTDVPAVFSSRPRDRRPARPDLGPATGRPPGRSTW